MRGRNQSQRQEAEQQLEVSVPQQLICPISLEMMKDPVTLCTGITYDRHTIQTWLQAGNDVCPATKQRLHTRDLTPNHTLRRLIHRWCLRNASASALDRRPVPPSSAELARLMSAAAAATLAALREAVVAAAGGDGEFREMAAATDGLAEGLVRLLAADSRRSPAAANACVACIYHMTGAERGRETLVRAGAVAALVEILPETDGGACEKALVALDALCDSAPGRSAAREHALTVPVVVKKMLRVSDLATELAVSILWTVCHDDGSSSDGSAVLEALQAGAFLKLLVLVQIGCEGKMRERATGLLKLFNKCAAGEWGRCADTLDLKQLKRSF